MEKPDDTPPKVDEVLEQLKTRALEILVEIEMQKQKAQSEALFAYQAKQNCEEHSTFIAQKKGQVEADLNAISAQKKTIDEFAASIPGVRATFEAETKFITLRRGESDESIAQILENRKKSESDSAVVKSLRASSEEANTSIRTLQQSSQASSDSAAVNAVAITKLLSELTEKGAATVAQVELISRNETKSSDLVAKTKQDVADLVAKTKQDLADLVAEAKQDVADNKANLDKIGQANIQLGELLVRLDKLKGESEELKKRVEDLLPGATSAALASSFKQQGERFKKPKRNWIICFIICIGLLLAIALPSFLNLIGNQKIPSWDGLLLEFVHRLPLVIPLVWLAIYSGRNYMMAVRLEEDYAYKEAVSRAFEGYKEQMQTIKGKPDSDDPLLVLCTNVLKALAERPGRIYEGAQNVYTPSGELLDGASSASELLRNRRASR